MKQIDSETTSSPVGMGLFDLVSGWTLWAPFTSLTRGLQGYVVRKITWSKGRNGTSSGFNLFATIVSVPFMVAGYYIYEAILFSSWIILAASIPGDLVQSVVGMCVAIPVCIVLKKVLFFYIGFKKEDALSIKHPPFIYGS